MLEKLPVGMGGAFRMRRAGLEQTVIHRLNSTQSMDLIAVRSPAFGPGQIIPTQHTADGSGVSPPLQWEGIPESASSIIVMVEDADSPTPHPLLHTMAVNLDSRKSALSEGALDGPHHTGLGLHTGRNSYLSKAWLPPDPPPGHGLHRYVFQVFALQGAPLSDASGRSEVFNAVYSRGLAAGHMIGTYERVVRAANSGRGVSVQPAPQGQLRPA